ncbi:MAG: helix-turn-helix domain-containing protein [Prosthecobacter sp.]|nr:helix-turn-helix domain-containing protein [Prosthecobacter sp.]
MHHPILPFCLFTIRVSPEAFKTFTLRRKGFIDQPRTLGKHLRNRRMKVGLRQEDVAGRLGTLREFYERWERDARKPLVSEWPGILFGIRSVVAASAGASAARNATPT